MRQVWNAHRLQLLHELRLRGTIGAVADALRFAPSTVSQQLALLEKEVGVTLLEPDGRRLRFTAHGETVAAHAARILAMEEELRDQLGSIERAPAPIRIAAMQTAARVLVPGALDIVQEAIPNLRVDVSVVPPEHGLFELAARGFDIVIAEQYPGHTRERRPELDRAPVGEDEILLATARGSDIRSIEDARDAAWVMEPEGTLAREWALQQCRAAGFEPDVRFGSADVIAHVRLIAAGHAVGLIPELALVDEGADVDLVRLPGHPRREIFTSARAAAHTSTAVVTTRDALTRVFSQHIR